jgi:hypothetical protein
MLAPWQELEVGNSHHHFTRAEAHIGTLATAAFASARIGEAESWLAESEAQSTTAATAQGQTAPPAATKPIALPVRLRRVRAVGLTLKTSLVVPARATIAQSATFGVGGKRRTACRVAARSYRASAVVLSCQLTRAARERLRLGPLKLIVVTTASADGGAKTVLSRHVTFRKR